MQASPIQSHSNPYSSPQQQQPQSYTTYPTQQPTYRSVAPPNSSLSGYPTSSASNPPLSEYPISSNYNPFVSSPSAPSFSQSYPVQYGIPISPVHPSIPQTYIQQHVTNMQT